jgi:hypothetical protein
MVILLDQMRVLALMEDKDSDNKLSYIDDVL